MDIMYRVSRLFAVPPGTPADIVRTWRKAFSDMASLKAFHERAKKVHIPIDFLPGEKVQELMVQAANQSPETRQIVKSFLE
jgi:tripartite-type tricarboxylate transporter receptor subunit TctC